jgi:hypothetical protein
MVELSDSIWIELDHKTAGIELNPEIKPALTMGKTHGFLWIKEKSLLYSFGDNSYGKLAHDADRSDSLNFLYKVSCPIDLKEICALDTYTAMLSSEGHLYVTGLFMVFFEYKL